MRLLFIIENLHPHASAGGYYAPFKFAEHLAKRGHTTEVYAVNDLGWGRGTVERFRTLYRPGLSRATRLSRKLDKFLAAACDRLVLEPEVGRLGPDWIFGVFRESAIKAAALGRLHGIPVANFIYECPPWVREAAGEERFFADYRGYNRRLWEETRSAYLDSDVLFPNSEMSRSWNARWLDGREIAPPIHPGIDEEEMPCAEEPPEARRDGVPWRILYVGRLAPAKNVDLLIEAHAALDLPAELHIVGAGEEEGRLRALSRGRPDVVFHGYLPDRGLWPLYSASDLVVCPSSFEGFGMPPMQALYFGKACLVSDIPIFRELYGDHLEFFPHGDARGLAGALRRLLPDRAYRERRGRAGRDFVRERFTWAGAAARIEETLLWRAPGRRRAAAAGT